MISYYNNNLFFMSRKNHKMNNRNLLATANPCEQAIKGLRSEVNKEGIQKYFKENKCYTPESKRRFEEKRNIERKRKMANRRNRNK